MSGMAMVGFRLPYVHTDKASGLRLVSGQQAHVKQVIALLKKLITETAGQGRATAGSGQRADLCISRKMAWTSSKRNKGYTGNASFHNAARMLTSALHSIVWRRTLAALSKWKLISHLLLDQSQNICSGQCTLERIKIFLDLAEFLVPENCRPA